MRECLYRNGLFLLGFLVSANEAQSQSRWTFELGGTAPYNIPLPLLVRQSGQPDIHLTARYSSKPLEIPVCWIWRISDWSGHESWELQAIHHKLFLDNRPPEIEEFSISHGLNIVTINHGWQLDGYVARVGAGITIAHPENTIRGMRLPEDRGIFGLGYYMSGPAVMAGGGKQFSLIGGLFLAPEVMTTLSYADVPVEDGRAHVWNFTLQANFGLGYSFDESSSR